MAQANKKRKKTFGSDRRNIWLLVAVTVLIIGSIFAFTPPQEKINQGLDIQGGLSVVLSAHSNDGGAVTAEQMETSQSIIERRVNALGASEASVSIQGNDQILVQIPGLSDPEQALQTIGKTGKLEFARLDSFTDEDVKTKIENGQYETEGTYTDDYGNSFPSGETVHLDVTEGTYTPIVTGANITRVTVDKESQGSAYYAVNIELDADGTKAFADASTDLAPTHGQIVIILDGQVQSAPAVQSVINGGQVQITGKYTQDGANSLKTVLESGSLPVSFEFAQSQTVGPTLGQNALASGVLVALLGLLIVMLYLLFFYRGLGLITAAAMVVFAVLYLGLLGVLSAMGQFALSLSGVAGIVLTIGMAADSSILTLERFREEIRMGRSVRAASVTGVRHAILTSIDADLVTLVSALCLFFLASASVKGFGLTLSLGIMCDIVMMLLFKAPIIRLLAPHSIKKHPGFWGINDCLDSAIATGRIDDENAVANDEDETIKSKVVTAAKTVHGKFIKKDINFLGIRKIFLTAAAVVMVLCFACVGLRGLTFGIEFVGGTSVTFNQTGDITTDQMRQAFSDAGEPDAVVQTTENNGQAGFIVRTTTTDAQDAAGTATQVVEALGMTTDSFEVSTIGPDWGAGVIRSSIIAFLVSLLLIIAYIAVRFRDYKMGVIAVVALLHDLIIVVGIYALVGREVNPNTIAALLTILGYSLYDTVVVFHRINDNMQETNTKCTFMSMANHSINQVLIRSINTSVTSLIPVAFMLFFGSETLKDFAFPMVIGLIAGAYSSIAIATPLYSIWKTHEPKFSKLQKKLGSAVQCFTFEQTTLNGPVLTPLAAAATDGSISSGITIEDGVTDDTKAEASEKSTKADKAEKKPAQQSKKTSNYHYSKGKKN